MKALDFLVEAARANAMGTKSASHPRRSQQRPSLARDLVTPSTPYWWFGIVLIAIGVGVAIFAWHTTHNWTAVGLLSFQAAAYAVISFFLHVRELTDDRWHAEVFENGYEVRTGRSRGR